MVCSKRLFIWWSLHPQGIHISIFNPEIDFPGCWNAFDLTRLQKVELIEFSIVTFYHQQHLVVRMKFWIPDGIFVDLTSFFLTKPCVSWKFWGRKSSGVKGNHQGWKEIIRGEKWWYKPMFFFHCKPCEEEVWRSYFQGSCKLSGFWIQWNRLICEKSNILIISNCFLMSI